MLPKHLFSEQVQDENQRGPLDKLPLPQMQPQSVVTSCKEYKGLIKKWMGQSAIPYGHTTLQLHSMPLQSALTMHVYH